MLLIAILLIGAISYGAAGLDLKFNTDGKLHEEKLLNRSIVSEDTELEIRKAGNGDYEIVRSLEEADGEVSVEKAIVKKNSICDESICIGYDVELKKAVFIDPEDMRQASPKQVFYTKKRKVKAESSSKINSAGGTSAHRLYPFR